MKGFLVNRFKDTSAQLEIEERMNVKKNKVKKKRKHEGPKCAKVKNILI